MLVTLVWLLPMIVFFILTSIIASVPISIAISYFTKKRFLTTFIIIFSITFILVTLISLEILTPINNSNNSEKLHWVD